MLSSKDLGAGARSIGGISTSATLAFLVVFFTLALLTSSKICASIAALRSCKSVLTLSSTKKPVLVVSGTTFMPIEPVGSETLTYASAASLVKKLDDVSGL